MNLFITGTDTGAGKTTVAAWVCSRLKTRYWKLIQTGDDSDTAVVQRFAPHTQIVREAYRLHAPLSVFDAAKEDGTTIDTSKLAAEYPHFTSTPLGQASALDKVIIEGAGGVFVPIANEFLMIDAIKQTNSVALIVVRSKLGMINHILLTVSALKNKHIPIVGLVVCGNLRENLKNTIEQFSHETVLAILPTVTTPSFDSFSHLFANTPIPEEIQKIII